MNPAFWAGKRVLVTGHTGFKGSWLTLWLQDVGSQVVGYSLEPPSEPSLYEVAEVASGIVSIRSDVRDLARLVEVVRAHRPEIIIHMAAQSLVRESYQQPVDTYAVNVMGTVNVLEAARMSAGVRVVINVTSDKCYDNKEWLWGYRENEPLGGYDPYSSSKACAELVTQAYRRSFFWAGQDSLATPAVASVRAGNVIGGGDWAKDRLVPDIIKALERRRPPIIRYANAIRPWQHVLDPLNGYLILAERLWDNGAAYADAWNFGPDESDTRPVSWVADELCRLWGAGIHWQPKLRLDSALEWVVEWYQAYQRRSDMRRLTQMQIRRYQAMGPV